MTASPPRVCFHCGLPVPADTHLTLTVFDEPRPLCCRGCLSVCKTIVDNGLEDYYRHRDAPADRVDARDVPRLLKELTLYDRDEIQKGFVRTHGAWREAALILEEIRCPACLWLNEQHLRGLPGVLDVDIDYTTQRARVRWDPARIQLSRILQAITDIGYAAHPFDPRHRDQLLEDQRRRSGERLIFAGILGMVMMNFAIATYVMGAPDPTTGGYAPWVVIGRWTALVVTAAILVYPGADFLVGAWRDVKHRRLGMDVPIALGLITAFAGSVWATVTQRGEVYYDSIAMFVFLLLLARRAEMRGRERAATRLDALAKVVPRHARRMGVDGGIEEVAVIDIGCGDRIQLLPGQVAPVDGVVAEGVSAFDESLLSGESRLVVKRPGDTVVAGSLNGDQPVVLVAQDDSAHSTVSQIQGLLQRALGTRPRFAILAEQAAAWFVAVVLAIAGLTAGVWLWLDPASALPNTVAVLIVTCPCALALATPVALTVSAGRFAGIGVFPLRMSAIEPLAVGDVVAFDKTGTLTLGRPVLAAVHPCADLSADVALTIAAALGRHSEHPVARALCSAAGEVSTRAEQLVNLPGSGITGRVDGEEWRLGTLAFAAGTGDGAGPQEVARRLQIDGHLVSALGGPGGVQALFALHDGERPGLKTMMQELAALGVQRFAILSGDGQANVDRIGTRLGIAARYGGLAPQDKLGWIQAQQDKGHRVIMVGDGINDAPILAAADASLSFHDATELAQASSDFTILSGHLQALPQARALARRTRRIIMENLAWAAAYNLTAVPAAALGLISPWGAAIGMSLSSLLVVGNSLRLQRHAHAAHLDMPMAEGSSMVARALAPHPSDPVRSQRDRRPGWPRGS